MVFEAGFGPAARFLLVAGAFVLVVACLHTAASFVASFLLAGFIAVIVVPAMFSLIHRGIPAWPALLAISTVMLAVGGLIIALVSGSLNAFMANLPEC